MPQQAPNKPWFLSAGWLETVGITLANGVYLKQLHCNSVKHTESISGTQTHRNEFLLNTLNRRVINLQQKGFYYEMCAKCKHLSDLCSLKINDKGVLWVTVFSWATLCEIYSAKEFRHSTTTFSSKIFALQLWTLGIQGVFFGEYCWLLKWKYFVRLLYVSLRWHWQVWRCHKI